MMYWIIWIPRFFWCTVPLWCSYSDSTRRPGIHPYKICTMHVSGCIPEKHNANQSITGFASTKRKTRCESFYYWYPLCKHCEEFLWRYNYLSDTPWKLSCTGRYWRQVSQAEPGRYAANHSIIGILRASNANSFCGDTTISRTARGCLAVPSGSGHTLLVNHTFH